MMCNSPEMYGAEAASRKLWIKPSRVITVDNALWWIWTQWWSIIMKYLTEADIQQVMD